MNPRLLKAKDLEKCYNKITGTDSKGVVSRKEMEEHFLYLKARFPIETHLAMVGVLQNDEKMFKEGMIPLYRYRPNKGMIISDVTRTGVITPSEYRKREEQHQKQEFQAQVKLNKLKLEATKHREQQKQAVLGLGFTKDPVVKMTTMNIRKRVFKVRHTDTRIIDVKTEDGEAIRNDSLAFQSLQEILFPTPGEFSYKLKGTPQEPIRVPKLEDYGPNWTLLYGNLNYKVRYLDVLHQVHEKDFLYKHEALQFIETIPVPLPPLEEDFVTLDTGFNWTYN